MALRNYFSRFKNWFDRSEKKTEHVYVSDSLHQQFLKEELLDRYSRGLSPEKRQLYARVISAASALAHENAEPNEAMARLQQAGLDLLIKNTQADSATAIHDRLIAELKGLIDYWEEPHLLTSALPVVQEALHRSLKTPTNPN